MGRKGVSKRKPKKSGTSSNVRTGKHSQVQSLVQDKGAPLNKGMNPSNRTQKKH